MRQQGRDHYLYLRRRIEDYPDRSQPAPRWTDLDFQAVSSVLREIGSLQRFYRAVFPLLQERGIQASVPVDDEDEFGSVYDLELKQSRARASTPGLLLFSTGLFTGLFAREVWQMLA
jgi:hypothetical protein